MKEHAPHNPEEVPRAASIREELADISAWVATRRVGTDRGGSTK